MSIGAKTTLRTWSAGMSRRVFGIQDLVHDPYQEYEW
jgi:hypothetical protein